MRNTVNVYELIAPLTPTKATSFSLVYDCEAILPLVIQLSLLHTALALEMITEANRRLCLQELEALDEKRL